MTTRWLADIRLALRQLRTRPGFTAVAAGTLALGIGAATALFSVVYGVLISPYPYAAPEEIWAPGLSTAGGFQVFARSALDVTTFGSVAVLLVIAAAAASLLPAWRAAGVPPTEYMR